MIAAGPILWTEPASQLTGGRKAMRVPAIMRRYDDNSFESIFDLADFRQDDDIPAQFDRGDWSLEEIVKVSKRLKKKEN